MLLFGIQGAYQPAVQASIPALEDAVHLNSANAIINMVNSLAGIRGSKLNLQKSWSLILLCSCVLPMITLAVTFKEIPMLSYGIVVAACCFMMIASTIFSVEMISYAQWVTPAEVLGKVMALLSCLAMCSNPLGQIIYGFLFEKLASHVGSIFLGAFVICIVLTFISKKIIENVEPIN